MQDRFNFNAIVTGYYDIDTPDEYSEFEPQIYLENVDIWCGGDIGISRDDLETAIQKQYPNIDKGQFNQMMQYFEDNSCSSDNETYLTISPNKILQCTGLKDKNGKLIYEGDVVNIKYIRPDGLEIRKKCKIEFSYYSFCLYYKCGASLLYKEDCTYEVIGNIYENKELLNE